MVRVLILWFNSVCFNSGAQSDAFPQVPRKAKKRGFWTSNCQQETQCNEQVTHGGECRLQKQASQLVYEKGYMRQQLQNSSGAATDTSCESVVTTQHSLKDATNPAGFRRDFGRVPLQGYRNCCQLGPDAQDEVLLKCSYQLSQCQKKLRICRSLQSASQVHGGQFIAGYVDGSVRLFDISTPEIHRGSPCRTTLSSQQNYAHDQCQSLWQNCNRSPLCRLVSPSSSRQYEGNALQSASQSLDQA